LRIINRLKGEAPAAFVAVGFMLLILLYANLYGCAARNPASKPYTFEQYSRDTIRGLGAFLVQAQANHLADCTAKPEMPLCRAINIAIDIHEAAKQMLISYCASPGFLADTEPCSPPESASVRAAKQEELRRKIGELQTAKVEAEAAGAKGGKP